GLQLRDFLAAKLRCGLVAAPRPSPPGCWFYCFWHFLFFGSRLFFIKIINNIVGACDVRFTPVGTTKVYPPAPGPAAKNILSLF
ncbi:hypothetical protein, partial [Enterobacter asburiae]